MTATTVSPSTTSQGYTLEFEAIGTQWHIAINQRIAERQGRLLEASIADLIEQFDHDYSRFRQDSRVSRIAKRAGEHSLPANAQALMRLYRQLYELTHGAVTPLIGQALADAGYDAAYSFSPQPIRPIPEWDAVMRYEHPLLITKQPLLLDFGAAGKGYLVDLVAELLQANDITRYTIDAGGDIVHYGSPLAVGLEDPSNPTQVLGVAQLQDRSICGSAVKRRAWGAYHHIIDPRQRASPQHLLAVWVVADSALLADGLTTALFFATPEQLQKVFSFEYAIVATDFSLTRSAGFPATFFTANGGQQ